MIDAFGLSPKRTDKFTHSVADKNEKIDIRDTR